MSWVGCLVEGVVVYWVEVWCVWCVWLVVCWLGWYCCGVVVYLFVSMWLDWFRVGVDWLGGRIDWFCYLVGWGWIVVEDVCLIVWYCCYCWICLLIYYLFDLVVVFRCGFGGVCYWWFLVWMWNILLIGCWGVVGGGFFIFGVRLMWIKVCGVVGCLISVVIRFWLVCSLVMWVSV